MPFLKVKILTLTFLVFFTGQLSIAYAQTQDYYFSGEVLEVIAESSVELASGDLSWQQDLRILAIDGPQAGQEVIYQGQDLPAAIKNNRYQSGDKVSVVASASDSGEVQYLVNDYIRTGALLWTSLVFVFMLLLVGRFKGLRALLSLALTFTVIIKYIIPQILSGASPVIVTIIGSSLILLLIIYLTEGFNRISHVAVLSILIGLLVTVILSVLGIKFAHLSGLDSEEAFYLIEIAGRAIDFSGLLLAGIIIGTLGVIDDIVISQIATVDQIHQANPSLNSLELFWRAQSVGVSHISSMINTLFLAYAGVSLPLLIFFVSGESVFNSWLDIVNNEAIATEIIRALCGSIGLIAVVPVSTFLAVKFARK